MIKKNEKQTALRLLGKYADEYHVLQRKSQELIQENNDLKSNLKINKEIIDSFFQNINLDTKMKNIYQGLKKENHSLSSNLKECTKTISELHQQIDNLNQLLSKNSIIYSQETDKIKSEVFVLKNIIIQKDNQIKLLKLKLSHHSTDNIGQRTIIKSNVKEVYVTNPTPLMNRFNDEVSILKELNKKLSNHIRALKVSVQKYETLIQKYESDVSKYKEEINTLKQNNNNNKIISKLGYQNFMNAHKSINSNAFYLKNGQINNTNSSIKQERCKTEMFLNTTNSNSNILKRSMISNLEEANKSKKKMNKMNLTEEWVDTLKYCNLTQDEYLMYCSSKKTSKLTDAIEFLYKIIVEKNIQISLLTNDNDYINSENIKLNKMNMELTEELAMIKSNKTLSNINSTLMKKNDTKESSVFVNTDINEVFQTYPSVNAEDFSVTSSEFREGMIVDRFDIESQMSKVKNTQ